MIKDKYFTYTERARYHKEKTKRMIFPMKRMMLSVTALLLSLTLAACSGGTSSSSPASSQPESSVPASSSGVESEPSSSAPVSSAAGEASQADASETSEPAESAEGGTLIAYFSWSGNTEQLAQMIQAETGGQLFEITPATPYTEDYNTLLDVARQEQADNARPELASQVENWDSCDTVFVGYPDWWSDAPMLIYSFLESCDWTGKTLIPFCTSGGSGFGRSLDKLPDSAPGATILEGFHVNGSSVDGAGEDVAAWLDGLGL